MAREKMAFKDMNERQRKSFIYRIMKKLIATAGWKHKQDKGDIPQNRKHCHISYGSAHAYVYRRRTVPFVCPDGHAIQVPCTGRMCSKYRCQGRSLYEYTYFNFFYEEELIRIGNVTLPISDPKLAGFIDAVFALKQWLEDTNEDVDFKSLINMNKLKNIAWDVTQHEWINVPKGPKMPKTPAGLVLRTIQINTKLTGQLMSDYQEDDKDKPYYVGNTFLRLTDRKLPTMVVFEFDKKGRMLVRLGGQNGKVWLTLGKKCDPRSPEWPSDLFIKKGTNIVKLMLNLEAHI